MPSSSSTKPIVWNSKFRTKIKDQNLMLSHNASFANIIVLGTKKCRELIF
jgi:hypothetical protein